MTTIQLESTSLQKAILSALHKGQVLNYTALRREVRVQWPRIPGGMFDVALDQLIAEQRISVVRGLRQVGYQRQLFLQSHLAGTG